MSDQLNAWKQKGTFINYGKFEHQLFVLSFGNENAIADKTLLLIHGFPESSFSFHKVIDGLLEKFDRIILFDMLGYGFSDKPIDNYNYTLFNQADSALFVWEYFNITGGHIIAHDMGDSVTTEILSRHENDKLPNWFSDGIKSITFTNGSMVLDLADLRITQKILLSTKGKIFNLFTNAHLFNHQVKSAHGNHNLSDQDLKLLWELNRFKNGHRKTYLTIQYLNDRKKYEKTRWLPSLAQTKIPIHICWGNDDSVARIEMAYYLKEAVCQQATLSIMEDVGHFCQIGSPQKWLTAILQFYSFK